MRKKPRHSHAQMLWLVDCRGDESGAETIEWIALSCVLLVLLCAVLGLFYRQPELAQSALAVGIAGLVMGAIGWSIKQTISTLHLRAQLLILEILSDGEPRSRHEIGTLLREKGVAFRVMPLDRDALAMLVLGGRVVVHHSEYTLTDSLTKPTSESALR
ncbi:MAG TPA: hypothetical protein VMW58_14210 [Anaerolineae bacterium]|nr:hypothetical protein [Anaerolineae bacterium]